MREFLIAQRILSPGTGVAELVRQNALERWIEGRPYLAIDDAGRESAARSIRDGHSDEALLGMQRAFAEQALRRTDARR